MQFRKFLWVLSLIGVFSMAGARLDAQEIRRNDKGEKIIVYQDGSWQYFSDLISGNDVIFQSPGETNDKFPVFGGQVAPMEGPLVSVTEEYAQRIFLRKAQLTREAADIARAREQKAREQRELLEMELRNLAGAEEEVILRQQNRLKAARSTESRAVYETQNAQMEAERADLQARSGNYLAQLKKQQEAAPPPLAGGQTTELLKGNFYNELLKENPAFWGILPAQQGFSEVERHICKFAYEGIDEYSGQYRRDVQKELLFNHTDDKLRPYLKDKEYLTCEAFMSSIAGGFRFLSLQFTFAYPNAREAYGFIEEGSFLTVKLLDGGFVNLSAGAMDRGRYDTETGLLTYQVHYGISPAQINILKKAEVDTVMVFWSSGYEEYKVYNVDFFIQQIYCLDK